LAGFSVFFFFILAVLGRMGLLGLFLGGWTGGFRATMRLTAFFETMEAALGAAWVILKSITIGISDSGTSLAKASAKDSSAA
jgi:hypothetical protein